MCDFQLFVPSIALFWGHKKADWWQIFKISCTNFTFCLFTDVIVLIRLSQKSFLYIRTIIPVPKYRHNEPSFLLSVYLGCRGWVVCQRISPEFSFCKAQNMHYFYSWAKWNDKNTTFTKYEPALCWFYAKKPKISPFCSMWKGLNLSQITPGRCIYIPRVVPVIWKKSRNRAFAGRPSSSKIFATDPILFLSPRSRSPAEKSQNTTLFSAGFML